MNVELLPGAPVPEFTGWYYEAARADNRHGPRWAIRLMRKDGAVRYETGPCHTLKNAMRSARRWLKRWGRT